MIGTLGTSESTLPSYVAVMDACEFVLSDRSLIPFIAFDPCCQLFQAEVNRRWDFHYKNGLVCLHLMGTLVSPLHNGSHVLSRYPRGLFLRKSLLGFACGTTDVCLSVEWYPEYHQFHAARRLQSRHYRQDTFGSRVSCSSCQRASDFPWGKFFFPWPIY